MSAVTCSDGCEMPDTWGHWPGIHDIKSELNPSTAVSMSLLFPAVLPCHEPGLPVKSLFLLMSVDSTGDSWNPIQSEAADLSD